MPYEVNILCSSADCFNQWRDRNAVSVLEAFEGAKAQGWEIGLTAQDNIYCPWCLKRRAQDQQGRDHENEVNIEALRGIAQNEIRAWLRRTCDKIGSTPTADKIAAALEHEAEIPF